MMQIQFPSVLQYSCP